KYNPQSPVKSDGISSVVEYKCFRSDEYQTQQEKDLQRWRKLSVNTGILTKIREINQLRGLLSREQLSRFTEREAIQKVLSPPSGRTHHCLPQPTSSAAKSFHTKSACFFHSSNTPGMAAGPVDAKNLKLLGGKLFIGKGSRSTKATESIPRSALILQTIGKFPI
ncbi:hypothetical protein PoB_006216400, partial [Plakobranchus ocellatus]